MNGDDDERQVAECEQNEKKRTINLFKTGKKQWWSNFEVRKIMVLNFERKSSKIKNLVNITDHKNNRTN